MESYDNCIKAGRIAAEAMQWGKELIKPGAMFLEVSNKIEDKIRSLGGECAFPVQISFDHVAAHNCAEPDDKLVFDRQLCCLDIGVHIEGSIGDTACTIDLSRQNAELVKAAGEALENALKIIRIGVTLGEIGKTIQETIESHGFTPIRNLSGHGLSPYNIHDKPSIPNIDTKDKTQLKKGMIIAIEPFATNGSGMIHEADRGNIFSQIGTKPVRSRIAREILRDIEEYNGLPFTTRWLTKKHQIFKVNFSLKELLNLGIIKQYPPLPEIRKGMVSQAEHTCIIDEKVIITTKI
jgi:methionyl aminopeptidase